MLNNEIIKKILRRDKIRKVIKYCVIVILLLLLVILRFFPQIIGLLDINVMNR